MFYKVIFSFLLLFFLSACQNKEVKYINYYISNNLDFEMKSCIVKICYIHSSLFLDDKYSKELNIYKKGYINYLVEYEDVINFNRYDLMLLVYKDEFSGQYLISPESIDRVDLKKNREFKNKFKYLRDKYTHYIVRFKKVDNFDRSISKIIFLNKTYYDISFISKFFHDSNNDNVLFLTYYNIENQPLKKYTLTFNLYRKNIIEVIKNSDISKIKDKKILEKLKKVSPISNYYKIKLDGSIDLFNPDIYIKIKDSVNNKSYNIGINSLEN